MNNLQEQLDKYRNNGPNDKKYKAARRKLAISDIEQIIGTVKWQWFSFPIYIPTEWLEGWKDTLILHRGNKRDKLFELLKESRK